MIADSQDLAALLDCSFDCLQQQLKVNAATVPADYSGYRPCILLRLILTVYLKSAVAADTYRPGLEQQDYHGGKSIWRCVCL